MNGNEFLDTFKELIQTDMDIDLDTPLEDIEEWDSMAIMATIAWLDVEHSVKADFEKLTNLQAVRDIALMVPNFQE